MDAWLYDITVFPRSKHLKSTLTSTLRCQIGTGTGRRGRLLQHQQNMQKMELKNAAPHGEKM